MSVKLPSSIQQNIDQITGRTWLLPMILEWYEQGQERMLLLTGEPGTGKSMIMAWLAGHGALPEEATAREQLAKIRAQHKATHFCIAASGETAPRALAKNLAEQLTGNVPGFGDALKASLDELVRIDGVARAGTAMPGATLTGVQIGTLSLAGLGEELSFNRTLREPLKTLYKNGRDAPLLILVDALDEALTYTGATDIVRLLAKLEDLPEQVRFLVSTRPDPRVLKRFRGAKRVDLVEDAPPDVDDVQAYASGRLEKVEGLSPSKVGAFASRIAKAAGGIFLYAAIVLDELLDRLPSLADLDLDHYPLPDDLSGLYYDFLNRELGQVDDRWYGRFRPVLGLIAVGQGEGLTTKQFGAITGQEVEQTLRICRQYLSGELPEGPFRCFHRSFGEWLLEDEDNVDYHIDPADMHSKIADHYWRAHYPGWQGCDAYGMRYLPVHLIGGGEGEKLATLLLDFGWLQAKLGATDITSLIADYDLLPASADGRLVRDTLSLSAHVLRQDRAQLPAQLHARLLGRSECNIRSLLAEARQYTSRPRLQPLAASLDGPGGLLERTLTGHGPALKCVIITPDGQHIVSAGDGTVRVWNLVTGHQIHCLGGYDRYVQTVAITTDGKRIVSGHKDGTLRVWDLVTGRCLHTLVSHTNPVGAVAVKHDGQVAVSGSHDGTVVIWSLASGQPIYKRAAHSDSVSAVATTPSGQLAVSASRDHTLIVWDLVTGELLHTLSGHAGAIESVVITPDGRHALSASDDRSVKVWDLATGRERHSLEGHAKDVWAVAVTPDGQHAISGSADGTLTVFDLATGRQVRTLTGHTGAVRAIAITPDGQRVISASGDLKLIMWDLTSDRRLATLEGHTGSVDAVAVSPDGQRAVSAGYGGDLKVWNLATPAAVRDLPRHTSRVRAVTITPDGKRAVTASSDGTLKVWDLAAPRQLHTLTGDALVKALTITPDGQHAVCASTRIRRWHLDSGQEVPALEGHSGVIEALAVTPDGRHAVSASEDGTVRLWDLSAGREVRTMESHAGHLRAAAITPDGRHVLLGFPDGTLEVLRPLVDQDASLLKVDLKGFIRAVAITPDGRWAIPASDFERGLTFWDLTSGTVVQTLEEHEDNLHAVAVTPDGRKAVSDAIDGTLKVWDLATGREIHTLTGHSRTIFAVAFTPDSHRAATVSADRTLKVWDLTTSGCLSTFHADTILTACAIAPDGVTIVAGDDLGGVHFLRLEELM